MVRARVAASSVNMVVSKLHVAGMVVAVEVAVVVGQGTPPVVLAGDILDKGWRVLPIELGANPVADMVPAVPPVIFRRLAM